MKRTGSTPKSCGARTAHVRSRSSPPPFPRAARETFFFISLSQTASSRALSLQIMPAAAKMAGRLVEIASLLLLLVASVSAHDESSVTTFESDAAPLFSGEPLPLPEDPEEDCGAAWVHKATGQTDCSEGLMGNPSPRARLPCALTHCGGRAGGQVPAGVSRRSWYRSLGVRLSAGCYCIRQPTIDNEGRFSFYRAIDVGALLGIVCSAI